MTRAQAIEQLLDEVGDSLVVASLGLISRELFELRKKRGEPTEDFYMQGSMGCAVGIGLGLALNTKKPVYVLTGDGAFLMKLGSLATVLRYAPPNLHIIVLNNGCHESCGGQPTSFDSIKKYLPVRVIDIATGVSPDLGRPSVDPELITKKFREKVDS